MAIPLILYFNHAYIFPNSFSLFSNNAVSINKALPGFNLLDKNKVPIELPKNKVVVLDFWSTYCGVCYLKFPIFESVYQRYKDNPNVVFYGVHVSYKEDKFEDVIHLLDKYEYSFPLLSAIDKKEINSKLDVKLFPTILLIKNNEIRYKGALIVDEKIVFGNTINQIEELLNE